MVFQKQKMHAFPFEALRSYGNFRVQKKKKIFQNSILNMQIYEEEFYCQNSA